MTERHQDTCAVAVWSLLMIYESTFITPYRHRALRVEYLRRDGLIPCTRCKECRSTSAETEVVRACWEFGWCRESRGTTIKCSCICGSLRKLRSLHCPRRTIWMERKVDVGDAVTFGCSSTRWRRSATARTVVFLINRLFIERFRCMAQTQFLMSRWSGTHD